MPYLAKPNKLKKITFNRQDRLKIYLTSKWRELREAKLMQNPLCEICLDNDIVTPATQVHHIDSFMNYTGNDRLEKAYNFNNLQSLCETCHAKLHIYGKTNN